VSNTDYRPVLYTDLDDTLFQTSRKMTEPACETRLGAIAANGHHSYMTEGQARMVNWLHEATRMIPVTARSTDALSRCRIPFHHWKVASNGAVILKPDGTPLADWQETVRSLSDAARIGLEALDAIVFSHNEHGPLFSKPRFRHWIVEEYGMPIYFCVKSNGDESWLDDIEEDLAKVAGREFTHHRNGNNLSFTPIGISKQRAVAHLDAVIGDDAMRFGMGDSLTDLPFMRSCHMMIIPPGSQIDTYIGRQ
jgi:hydroxymethylpyrimidine pyrophosphatase-like HAD family hydrolase